MLAFRQQDHHLIQILLMILQRFCGELVCQASALPLSYGPKHKREGDICPKGGGKSREEGPEARKIWGAKTVGSVGASLALGKHGFGTGRSKGFVGIFSRREEKRTLGRMG